MNIEKGDEFNVKTNKEKCREMNTIGKFAVVHPEFFGKLPKGCVIRGLVHYGKNAPTPDGFVYLNNNGKDFLLPQDMVKIIEE